MGYDTKLRGTVTITPALTAAQVDSLNLFAASSHREPGYPGVWCQWVPTDDGAGLKWDGNEKFTNYVEWLNYLIDHRFKPWGCVLNGRVRWHGEEAGDSGVIWVKDNQVKVVPDANGPEPFTAGDDPYRMAAAHVLGVLRSQVTAEQVERTKQAFFLYCYGAGPEKTGDVPGGGPPSR